MYGSECNTVNASGNPNGQRPCISHGLAINCAGTRLPYKTYALLILTVTRQISAHTLSCAPDICAGPHTTN